VTQKQKRSIENRGLVKAVLDAAETPRFDVKIGDKLYPLHRDPSRVHPPELHHHLGTDTTTIGPESAIRRFLNAVEECRWVDEKGNYVGRNAFGVGLAGRE